MNKERAMLVLAFIMPIEQIIAKIKSNSYSDCDVITLDKYYKGLVRDTAKILKIEMPTTVEDTCNVDFPYFNEYVKNYYLERFTKLLQFYNSLEII